MIDSPLNYLIVAHLVKYAARQQSAENPQAEPTHGANPLPTLALAWLGRRLVNLGERLEGRYETPGRFAVES